MNKDESELIQECVKESRIATEQWVAEAFVQTNKRMDELIQRVVELEKKLDDHDRRGEFCPHTGV